MAVAGSVVRAGQRKWLVAHDGRSLLAVERDGLFNDVVVVAVLDAGAVALDCLHDVSLLRELRNLRFQLIHVLVVVLHRVLVSRTKLLDFFHQLLLLSIVVKLLLLATFVHLNFDVASGLETDLLDGRHLEWSLFECKNFRLEPADNLQLLRLKSLDRRMMLLFEVAHLILMDFIVLFLNELVFLGQSSDLHGVVCSLFLQQVFEFPNSLFESVDSRGQLSTQGLKGFLVFILKSLDFVVELIVGLRKSIDLLLFAVQGHLEQGVLVGKVVLEVLIAQFKLIKLLVLVLQLSFELGNAFSRRLKRLLVSELVVLQLHLQVVDRVRLVFVFLLEHLDLLLQLLDHWVRLVQLVPKIADSLLVLLDEVFERLDLFVLILDPGVQTVQSILMLGLKVVKLLLQILDLELLIFEIVLQLLERLLVA
jgi:hypothetical protein